MTEVREISKISDHRIECEAPGPLGMSDLNNNNKVGKISMKDVEAALSANATGPVNVPVTEVSYQSSIVYTF